jgi:alginate O-acetyltransferase complex protein AlgI
MVFSSYTFILAFLPVMLIGFGLLGLAGRRRPRFAWLVLGSLVYCGWWRLPDLAPLVVSIVLNYRLGRWLETGGPVHKRWLLGLGVSANLALLGYFKYAGFFADSVNALLGAGWEAPSIVLPIAISFYTFQQIAYISDAYHGRTREHSFLDYCLFVSFFPQLIAGPIVHHGQMLPQFYRKRLRLAPADLSVGISLFVFGLAKKVLIADELSPLVGKVFDADPTEPLTFGLAWVGVTAYALQIYFDFSGYSDMALGLGRMFGIRLPLNFNSPYRAASVIEFWKRWHITLSDFLRDYLYIPLGGNRRGKARRYVNLMLTMLLGGLWHGASWSFVLWGGLHGVYLMVNHLWRASVGPVGEGRVVRWVSRVLTFTLVLIAWVPFRAEEVAQVRRFYVAMFGGGGLDLSLDGFDRGNVSVIAGCLVLVWLMPNVPTIMRRYRPTTGRRLSWDGWQPLGRWVWRPEPFWAIVSALLSLACLMQMSRAGEFIYYRF